MTGIDSFIYCHPDINIKLPKKFIWLIVKKKNMLMLCLYY